MENFRRRVFGELGDYVEERDSLEFEDRVSSLFRAYKLLVQTLNR